MKPSGHAARNRACEMSHLLLRLYTRALARQKSATGNCELADFRQELRGTSAIDIGDCFYGVCLGLSMFLATGADKVSGTARRVIHENNCFSVPDTFSAYSRLVAFLLILWLPQGQADEPRTLCGKTVEGWREVFRDKTRSETERSHAVLALGFFGPEARAGAPDLIEAFRKGQFRDEVGEALVSIGAGTELIVPFLADRFFKRDWLSAGSFTMYYSPYNPRIALAGAGELAVPALIRVLAPLDEQRSVYAAYALGEIGPAARAAVPSLIRAIEHPGFERKESLTNDAIRALGLIGPDAKAATPALIRLLDGYYDDQAVWALDRIGAPPVQQLLERFMRDGDSYSADLLAWLGPRAITVAPALRVALSDKRLQTRINAAILLAHVDHSATDVIPALIKALNQQDDDLLVGDVPSALARFGLAARSALPVLIDLVNKGRSVSSHVRALLEIDPQGKECVPALIAALKHEDSSVVQVAAQCLGVLGPRASAAIPALTVALEREFHEPFIEESDPQVSAAKALRRVDLQGKSAIPALIRILKRRRVLEGGPGLSAVAAATEAMSSYGSEARDTIPALIEVLRDRHEERRVRLAAARALGQIRPEGKVAIPELRDCIEENKAYGRFQAEAVVALYHLAPDGKELAERWLQKPLEDWTGWGFGIGLPGRTMVRGAIGRTSFESDWLTRRRLEGLDIALAHSDPLESEPLEHFEWWFEEIGRFGVAGRLAIPRLREFCKRPSPFVRMWANEALERIMPAEGRARPVSQGG